MSLIVNGARREVQLPVTLARYLQSLGLHERPIVVEHNGEILRRDTYERTELQPGDTLEIVQMVAGG